MQANPFDVEPVSICHHTQPSDLEDTQIPETIGGGDHNTSPLNKIQGSTPASKKEAPLQLRKRWRNVDAEVEFLYKKTKTWIEDGKQLNLKKDCFLRNGIIYKICAVCKIEYDRTSEYFYLEGSCTRFAMSPPGHEALHNTCKKCVRSRDGKKRASREGFIGNILRRYPNLDRAWFDATLAEQNHRGYITNMVMNFTTNSKNAVGIHRIDNKKNHIPGNCFLELQELNVAQWRAIPNLMQAWIAVFNELLRRFSGATDETDYLAIFKKQYGMTPKKLGIRRRNNERYAQECTDKILKTVLRRRIRHNIVSDMQVRKLQLPVGISIKQFANMIYPHAIDQLHKQNGRCGLTEIGLTFELAWNQLSFERINNALPHFTLDGKLPNCIFICRLFNVPRQLSSHMIMEYFLQQKLVKVPDDVRERAIKTLPMPLGAETPITNVKNTNSQTKKHVTNAAKRLQDNLRQRKSRQKKRVLERAQEMKMRKNVSIEDLIAMTITTPTPIPTATLDLRSKNNDGEKRSIDANNTNAKGTTSETDKDARNVHKVKAGKKDLETIKEPNARKKLAIEALITIPITTHAIPTQIQTMLITHENYNVDEQNVDTNISNTMSQIDKDARKATLISGDNFHQSKLNEKKRDLESDTKPKMSKNIPIEALTAITIPTPMPTATIDVKTELFSTDGNILKTKLMTTDNQSKIGGSDVRDSETVVNSQDKTIENVEDDDEIFKKALNKWEQELYEEIAIADMKKAEKLQNHYEEQVFTHSFGNKRKHQQTLGNLAAKIARARTVEEKNELKEMRKDYKANPYWEPEHRKKNRCC